MERDDKKKKEKKTREIISRTQGRDAEHRVDGVENFVERVVLGGATPRQE
jgi:hypothetical protein